MKRILAAVLAATLLFLTLSVPAGAESVPAAAAAIAEDAPPVIVIRGLYFDGLTVDAGTPNERNAIGPFAVGDILKTLGRIGFQWLTKGKQAAVSEICAYGRKVFGGFVNDKNGDPLREATFDSYPLSLDHYPDSALANGKEREEGLAHAVMDTVGGSKTYYFSAGGAMLTGWQKINNKWYYFSAGGAMMTDWQKISNKWYYFDANGAMLTGWQSIGGKWYYFEAGGAMAANKWVGNYYLTGSGAMATNTWIGQYYVGPDGKWIPNYKAAN